MTEEDAKKARKQILVFGIGTILASGLLFLISDSMGGDLGSFVVFFFGAITVGWSL